MKDETIIHKIAYLKKLLIKIEIRLNKYKIEKDLENKETYFAAISKFVEESVETAIKINNILLEKKKDYANTYYETFSKLQEHFNIDSELFEKLAKTTGFRNRISHEYDKLNVEISIKSFENIIKLYEGYILEIKKII